MDGACAFRSRPRLAVEGRHDRRDSLEPRICSAMRCRWRIVSAAASSSNGRSMMCRAAEAWNGTSSIRPPRSPSCRAPRSGTSGRRQLIRRHSLHDPSDCRRNWSERAASVERHFGSDALRHGPRSRPRACAPASSGKCSLRSSNRPEDRKRTYIFVARSR